MTPGSRQLTRQEFYEVWSTPRCVQTCAAKVSHKSRERMGNAYKRKNRSAGVLDRCDDFVGRSGIFPDTLFQNVENGGVIFSQGENWREQRRASIHILRDFGMGKNLMEEQVLLSAQDFLAHMSSIENKDELYLREPIQVFIGNIINKTLYGFSYEYDECSRMMNAADTLNILIETL
ncbi:hypothetical protein TELCIR_18307, partial [Teladorsagia circumcincta]